VLGRILTLSLKQGVCRSEFRLKAELQTRTVSRCTRRAATSPPVAPACLSASPIGAKDGSRGLPRSPARCEATPGKPPKNLLSFAGHPPAGGRQKRACSACLPNLIPTPAT